MKYTKMKDTNMKKSLNVAKQMFVLRNYTLEDEGVDCLKGLTKNGDRVHLYWIDSDKLNVSIFKYYVSVFLKEQVKHGILIYGTSITSTVQSLRDMLYQVHIEFFSRLEMSFNPIQHEFVPIHEKIDHFESNEKKYPLIRSSDPIVRRMGFQIGDVLKIHRNDGTLYYRYVVK